MNNLKQLRGDTHQSDLVAALNIPSLDRPLYSRIESGIVNPTPEVAQKIADFFNTEIAQIWPVESLTYWIHAPSPPTLIQACAHGQEGKKYDVVTRHIPAGKQNAISRRELEIKTGFKDRHNRELIEDARLDGHMIVSTGKGYHYTEDVQDIAKWYTQELHRAQSVWMRLSIVRRLLDRLIPGQLKLGVCVRCGDPIEDGMYCEYCKQKIESRAKGSEAVNV